MAKQSLDVFIRQALNDNTQEKPCERFVLCHMVGVGRIEVMTHKVGGTGSYDPKALATMFLGRADQYCQDMRGEQRFFLDAYYGDPQPGMSQPFRRMPDAEDGGHGTEPPTEEGRTMQKMRWENSLLQSVYARQEQLDRRVDRLLEAAERERAGAETIRGNLMSENMDMFTKLKDLMIMATIDRHKMDMEKIQAERVTAREQKIMEYAPVALNILTGREVIPQSKVDTTILEAIAKRITPEQIPMLAMLGLSDEEMGVLMHRFNQIKDKQIAEEKARRELPHYQGSAEDDVQGGAPQMPDNANGNAAGGTH